MRHLFTTAILLIALSVVSASVSAAPAAQTKPAAKTAAKATPVSHSTTGVVKSIDANTLVITRSGKKGGAPITFVVNSSTQREGTVDVGSPVSVRYHAEGKSLVAMAITARPIVQQASSKTGRPRPRR